MKMADVVMDPLAGPGCDAYPGEPVSQAEHALQAAWPAERDAAPESLVVPALPHDVGRLVPGTSADAAEREGDAHHEDAGALRLAGHFGPEVAGPARLHIAARRHLCTVAPMEAEAEAAAKARVVD